MQDVLLEVLKMGTSAGGARPKQFDRIGGNQKLPTPSQFSEYCLCVQIYLAILDDQLTLTQMKNLINDNKNYLIAILFLFGIGCNVVNHNNQKITGGLQFSDQTIPAHSVLLVRTQDKSSFKAKGENLSENKIVIKDNDTLRNLAKKAHFDLTINQDNTLEFINNNDQEVKLYFTIYGHQSKIISSIKNNK